MSYALRYKGQYSPFVNSTIHSIEFHKKDYTGDSDAIVCSAIPVVHKWGTDDPKAPIKGSNIDITLVNVSGTFPLSNFFSVEDDTWLVKYFIGTDLKFIGYLVQDDCTEIQDDFTHEIKLSANDNIGLLKDILLDQAILKFGTYTSYTSDVSFTLANTAILSLITPIPDVGNAIIFSGITSSVDGLVFQIVKRTIIGGLLYIYLDRPVPDTSSYSSATVTYIDLIMPDLDGRYPLRQIIGACLSACGLGIHTNVYSQILPVGYTDGRWLDDTYMGLTSFLNNDQWQDCNKVLTTIFTAFKATIFQAEGLWNIVRWNEARQYSGLIPGYEYDEYMVFTTTIHNLPEQLNFGNGSDIETGLTQSILRPYKFVKETFNFDQPANVLKNGNFTKVGALITTYTDIDGNTVNEYEMSDWFTGHFFYASGLYAVEPSLTRFIRVVTSPVGAEIERYGVIKGQESLDAYAGADSSTIELAIGDAFKYSLSYRFSPGAGIGGTKSTTFRANLRTTLAAGNRNTNDQLLLNDGSWHNYPFPASPIAFFDKIPNGDSGTDWHSISITSKPVPVNGLLTFNLPTNRFIKSTTKETHFKDIQFEVFRSVAGSLKVIGQTHTDSQIPVIKNSSDTEILADDAPSSVIRGALFLQSFTGPLQDLTTLWKRGVATGEFRLGQINTIDELFARRIQRLKLEGTLLSAELSLLNIITYTPLAGLNFLWGMLSLDYKNNTATGTLWEQYNDTEVDADLVENYIFKYLYQTQG